MSRSNRKPTTLRLSERERAMYGARAKSLDMRLSEYLRWLAQRDCDRAQNGGESCD